MDTARVAQILEEMGTLLEIRGENPFRCRAYHNAAQALRALPGDLAERIAAGRLAEVPGIGETIQGKIVQLATTGHLPAYEELRRQTPPGLVALLRVPGLGPRKIRTLHEELKIESLADLRAAGESGRIAAVKGFGAKTEARILRGIAFLEAVGDRILQSTARRLAAPWLEALGRHPGVGRAAACGSLRRRAETIGDLDLLFSAADPDAVLAAVVQRPDVARVLERAPGRAGVVLADGLRCDLRGVPEPQYAFALHDWTGPRAHTLAVRRRAAERGLALTDAGLEGPDGPVACASEAELFAAVGLHPIPPELRDEAGAIERAAAGPLPALVERADLTGTFHCHTDWSDGGASLAEMAAAARARGLAYLGIADHSRSAGYAGGLSVDRVRRQWDAIDALNAGFGGGFRLFKGIECDILPDGALDYPDELLAGFDYVVASVHSGFGLERDAMTRRLIRAVRHPMVTMLGHPTGRLLLARDAYALDLEAVLAAAAEAGTMIEINANPHRLDLGEAGCRRARQLGLSLVINPDAHAPGGLDDLDYGIGVARRAGLGPGAVVNAGTPEAVARLLVARR
ncbi:MAG TPA: DNA polymerase/3'-5' exonuclease PolX [Isosphaeraceae bacterium]|jgi:DNA polymerase (family 10)